MNWMIALENTMDAHNAGWVHRNCLRVLRSRTMGRPRTPVGYRVQIVDNKIVKAVRGTGNSAETYYADKDGRVPYQLYYPRVGGYWPLSRWRLLWTWFTDRRGGRRRAQHGEPRAWGTGEWGPQGQRLPSLMRMGQAGHVHTRWCIPVEENLTRILHVYALDVQGAARTWERLYLPIRNFFQFNFSNADNDAVISTRYQYQEFLSSTDSFMVALRKMIVDHARGLERPVEVAEETTAESLVYEADASLGVRSEVERVGAGQGGEA
jgi:hypothetical protein